MEVGVSECTWRPGLLVGRWRCDWCAWYAEDYNDDGLAYDMVDGCRSDPHDEWWRDHTKETCPRFCSWRSAEKWGGCVDLATWRNRRQGC